MPLYDYRCAACEAVKEEYRRYGDHDRPADCRCGGEMSRTFMPPRVMRDIEGYQSMVDGSWISSRSQHREHLKRHGMREVGNDKPDLTPRGRDVPRESIRQEIRNTVEKMKAGGQFREH